MVRTSGAGSSVVLTPRTFLPAIWRFISRTPLTSWLKCFLSILDVLHQLCQRLDLLARQVSLRTLCVRANQVDSFFRYMPVIDHPRATPLAAPLCRPAQLAQTRPAGNDIACVWRGKQEILQ